jgi:hypothetical protein
VVQIHSPRPILRNLRTYRRQNDKRAPGKMPIANTIDSEQKVPQFRQLETTHVRVSCQNSSNKFKYKKAGERLRLLSASPLTPRSRHQPKIL